MGFFYMFKDIKIYRFCIVKSINYGYRNEFLCINIDMVLELN